MPRCSLGVVKVRVGTHLPSQWWSQGQQHQSHLRTCWKCSFSAGDWLADRNSGSGAQQSVFCQVPQFILMYPQSWEPLMEALRSLNLCRSTLVTWQRHLSNAKDWIRLLRSLGIGSCCECSEEPISWANWPVSMFPSECGPGLPFLISLHLSNLVVPTPWSLLPRHFHPLGAPCCCFLPPKSPPPAKATPCKWMLDTRPHVDLSPQTLQHGCN